MGKYNLLNSISENTKKSETRLAKAQRIASVGNWEFDLINKTTWASGEAFKIYGLGNEEGFLPLKHIQSVVLEEDREKMDVALTALLSGTNDYDVEFRIKTFDTGEIKNIHSMAEAEYDINGVPIKVNGVIQDITKRVEIETKLKENYEELNALYEELAASEEELISQLGEISSSREQLQLSENRYRTLIDNSEDIIYSCDNTGIFTAVNNKFCYTMRRDENQIIGKTMGQIIGSKENAKKWNKNLRKVIKTGKTLYTENRINDKMIFLVTLAPIFDSNNKVVGITGTNHNVTLAKKQEETIKKMAYYDNLTGLDNRILFYKKLKEATKELKNQGKLAVLFIDIDNFKKVNDTLGHAMGDELLKKVAHRLKKTLSENGTLARISGDEFAAIFYNSSDVVNILDNTINAFKRSFYLGNSKFDITLSMGISMFPSDGENAEDLLKSADTAMYKAKELGKNCYQFYNIQMRDELLRKLNIELRMKKAILKDEFELYYQPQYKASNMKLRGFEALVRWNSSYFGFLTPSSFISIAEETGMIINLGEVILNKACDFAKGFGESGILVAVNISPLQLRQQNFCDIVLKAVNDSGINPSCLELEITENIFIDDFDLALEALNKLRDLGVRIALDDFGTGYSSLNYLKCLPINLLKIDKTFVDEIKNLEPLKDITESIISLVHKLNIETLAEGVEEEVQVEYLIKAGCDNFQGFYFEKPMPRFEAEKLLRL